MYVYVLVARTLKDKIGARLHVHPGYLPCIWHFLYYYPIRFISALVYFLVLQFMSPVIIVA